MGNAASTVWRHQDLGRSEQIIVQLMMPLYFDPIECTPAEHKLAEDCWNLVLTDKCPVFLAKKGTKDFPYSSCVPFFYDTFYVRLFDIHPEAKELFHNGMKGQGKFLVMMLSLALSGGTKPEDFHKSLIRLADIHFRKGVKSVECKYQPTMFDLFHFVADGIVGDVLMWTLRKVMGDEYYTPQLHRIWVKIYSSMLKVLVPAGVTLEMRGCTEDGSTSIQRQPTAYVHGYQSVSLTTSDDTLEPELESQKILSKHATMKKAKAK